MSGPSEAEPLGRHDDTIKKVAYLYAKGEPQKRIAGLLSLSSSMVSRLVDQARKVGLVRETIECELSKPEQQRLHDEVYRGKDLLSKLKDVAYDSGVGSLTQLQIVPTGMEIEDVKSWDQAVSVFGHKAATAFPFHPASSSIPVHFTQSSAYNVPPCPSYVPIPPRCQAKC